MDSPPLSHIDRTLLLSFSLLPDWRIIIFAWGKKDYCLEPRYHELFTPSRHAIIALMNYRCYIVEHRRFDGREDNNLFTGSHLRSILLDHKWRRPHEFFEPIHASALHNKNTIYLLIYLSLLFLKRQGLHTGSTIVRFVLIIQYWRTNDIWFIQI